MTTLYTAISSKGQLVIPAELREQMKLSAGTKVSIQREGNALVVRPITPETGPIKAEGVVLNRGRRIGTAEGRVTDDKGRLLAHGTTTCLIF